MLINQQIVNGVSARTRFDIEVDRGMGLRITDQAPPTIPFTSKGYTDHGLPWFDYYSDNSTALKGSEKLNGLKSVVEIGKEKGDNPLPENESVDPDNIVKLRKGLKKGQVREGAF